MIPGFDLATFAAQAGPWAAVFVLMAIIFAESGLLIGFFLPGDSILFTAGFLVQTGILKFDIHLLVVLVFLAAVLGDGVGYLFGRKIGRRLFQRPNSLLFRQENIQKAEEFYERHGSITIVIARFIPIVRTFAPIVAGVGKMKYHTFLTFNVIGALLWAVGITYAGFYVGAGLEKIGIEVDTILLPIIAVIILVSVLPPAIHIFKDSGRRTAMWNGTKKQIAILLKRSK
ncbi:MAG TPA: VTT domain-containing protein [Candidatus Saccharimonadales bacterium]|nr:VTT domain-containing protein [Candidatus Saccharimonadales bacterium]